MSPTMTRALLFAVACPAVIAQRTFELESFPDAASVMAGGLTAVSAELSQDGYLSVAELHSDEAMKVFATRILSQSGRKVLDENQFNGFVPYFSGTHAVQTFQKLADELSIAPWVGDAKDDGTLVLSHMMPMNMQDRMHQSPAGYNHSHQVNGVNASTAINFTSPQNISDEPLRGNGTPAVLPPALAAVRGAEEAENLAHERLQRVSSAVQHAQKLSSQSNRMVVVANRKISALKAAKHTADVKLDEARAAEKAARAQVAKLAHTGDKLAKDSATLDAHSAEAGRKKAVRATKIAMDHLKAAIVSERDAQRTSNKREKDLRILLKKEEGVKQVFQKKKQLTANATKVLKNQILEVESLTAEEKKLRMAYEKQAQKLQEVRQMRVDTMRKFNMSSEKTRGQVLETVRRAKLGKPMTNSANGFGSSSRKHALQRKQGGGDALEILSAKKSS